MNAKTGFLKVHKFQTREGLHEVETKKERNSEHRKTLNDFIKNFLHCHH